MHMIYGIFFRVESRYLAGYAAKSNLHGLDNLFNPLIVITCESDDNINFNLEELKRREDH